MDTVAIYRTQEMRYPANYRASEVYPEYRFAEFSNQVNDVYNSVRECFRLMGLDKNNFGTAEWNPLGIYIKPGDKVLIKPNMVMDVNFNKEDGTDCLYTNPSVVAAVVDYVLIALKGRGSIVIGDAPMQESNFDHFKENSGYTELIDYYVSHGYDVELVDFRELTSVVSHGVYKSTVKEGVKGQVVNIGSESEFYSSDTDQEMRLRITNYDPRILPTHHHGEIQEYYISQYVLDADVIINMPKPKTHRKAGITASLKNFIGANVRKEYLPHHTQGSLVEGGDEYLQKNILRGFQSKLLDIRNVQRAEKYYKRAWCTQVISRLISYALKLSNNKYSEGSWYGNHTISRTICDLNKIIFYADKCGKMQDRKQRKMFIVADMIVSGEKEGPVNPSSKNVGIIAMGDSPLAFDEIIANLMGFDINKIPTFEAVKSYKGKYRYYDEVAEIKVISNDRSFNKMTPNSLSYDQSLKYIPASGWKGHIELE